MIARRDVDQTCTLKVKKSFRKATESRDGLLHRLVVRQVPLVTHLFILRMPHQVNYQVTSYNVYESRV